MGDEIEEDFDNEDVEIKNYKMKIYGRDESGKSLTVLVNNFHPYFYIKVPDLWKDSQIITLINYVKDKVNKNDCEGFLNFNKVEMKDAYGFNADKLFKFIKLKFKSHSSFRKFENFFEYNKIYDKRLFREPTKIILYESNIEPFLRFMHLKNMTPCGWMKIEKFRKKLIKTSYCNADYEVDFKNIYSVENPNSGKLIVLSFDIECIADDGISFPQAENEKDHVTQIGSVFSYYGESEPFYKNIITLKKAKKIEGMEDTDIESYDSEIEVLSKWTELVQRMDPDVITGYNINGFDFMYLHKRAKKLGIERIFSRLGRNLNESCKFEEKILASSALGENILRYYDMSGRVIVDLMKVVQRDHKLGSYKLDSVASHFIEEGIKMYDQYKNHTVIYTKGIYGIKEEDFISIKYVEGFDTTTYDKKYKVLSLRELNEEEINNKYSINKDIKNYDDYNFSVPKKLFKIKIEGNIPEFIFTDNNQNKWHTLNTKSFKRFISVSERIEKDNEEDEEEKNKPLIEQKVKEDENPINGNDVFWTLAKDDMSPTNMFKFQKGTDEQRGILAKYCIKDCILVTQLMEKLKILNNNMGMANVCIVPLSYIFMRGQSVKIFSLVSKKCMEYGYLIPKIKKKWKKEGEDEEENTGYEGATVLTPTIGVHYEPIIVLDFAALYPRSMIYKNICMSKIVLDRRYDNLQDYTYKFATYRNNDGTTTTCKYAEHDSGEKGIYPKILKELLDERAAKKKMAKNAPNDFLRNIYDALQLAYKQTANSLYGQLGASVSPIYMKELAASTTATGREMLEYSKEFMEIQLRKLVNYSLHDKKAYLDYCEKLYKDCPPHKFIVKDFGTTDKADFIEKFYKRVNEILSSEYAIRPKTIYGDTDSVFFSAKIFKLSDRKVMTNRQALRVSIELGLLAGYAICAVLPEPEEQVYEKTLWPLILRKKKKYVGNLYEEDYTKYIVKCMGIELKRRDPAPIAKIASGGIVNNILTGDGKSTNLTINERNTNACEYIKQLIKKILRGEFPIEKFIISKTLRSTYKNRATQAHAVLADRIAARDPGKAPNINDRVPFVYIITKKKLRKGEKLLQGDKVEDPEYIKEHNLDIDLLFYITNQVMKPCLSYLELIAKNPKKIFTDYINKELNRRNGKRSINQVLDERNLEQSKDDDSSDEDNDNNKDNNIYNNSKKNNDNDSENRRKERIKTIKKKSIVIDI